MIGDPIRKTGNSETAEMIPLLNNISFARVQLPFCQKIMQLLWKHYYKLPRFQLINWEMTLREDGRPIFGDLTETVLQD